MLSDELTPTVVNGLLHVGILTNEEHFFYFTQLKP